MRFQLEFEVVSSADAEENARVFLARGQVELPCLPQQGSQFQLPCNLRARCVTSIFNCESLDSAMITIGLGSIEVDDFDSVYRCLRKIGFDLTTRQQLS